MKTVPAGTTSQELNEKLADSGFRSTAQRQHIYNVVAHQCDHPTAEDVFIQAKQEMPDISMATVYNTLDALLKSHLVKQVNLDRAATRYCPNMKDHAHFYCDRCRRVFDVSYDSHTQLPTLPKGFVVGSAEISIRGTCPQCTKGR